MLIGSILGFVGDNTMLREEHLIDEKVTYSIFKDGKFIIIENVPARVVTSGLISCQFQRFDFLPFYSEAIL